MADLSDERRDQITRFLQQQGPPPDQLRKGALLTGWVMVESWVNDEGEPWLTKGFAAEIPSWTADGMHHQALYANWGDEDD